MYLLLVDNNFVSSREIKSLLDKNNIDCEVINCSSSAALIDIAEKLAPDIVIIDFDFYIEDSDAIVRSLRQINKDAYILAFIDADHYENLRLAIEEGIDDYLVKPLQREDIMLRIKMGLQRKSVQVEKKAADTDRVVQRSEKETRQLFLDIADAFGRQDEDQQHAPARDEDKLEEQDADLDAVQVDQAEPVYRMGKYFEEADSSEQADKELESPEEFTGSPNQNGFAEKDLSFSGKDLFELESQFGPATEQGKQKDPLAEDQVAPDSFAGFDQVETGEKSNHFGEALPELSDADFQLFEPIDPESTKLADSAKKEDELESLEELFQGSVNEQPGYSLSPERKSFSPDPEAPPAPPKETAGQKKKSDKIDDSELFGTNQKTLTNGSKTFEDLFGRDNQPGKSSKVVPREQRPERKKEAKVEYLFPEKKAAEKDIPVPPAIPMNYQTQQKFVSIDNKSAQEKQEDGAPKKSSSFMRIAGNVITVMLLIMLFTLSFFLIQSRINEGTPTVAGYKMFVVLSGSMSPVFDTGSLVFVKPTEPLEIVENDIITFSSDADANRLTTHRVVGINREDGLSFVTRGDANNVNDPSPVPAENLVGRVTGSVPYIGYLFGFAQTRQGLILLIFVPGLLILLFEFRKIFGYMVDARIEKMAGAGGPGHSPGPPPGSQGPQGDYNYPGRSYGQPG